MVAVTSWATDVTVSGLAVRAAGSVRGVGRGARSRLAVAALSAAGASTSGVTALRRLARRRAGLAPASSSAGCSPADSDSGAAGAAAVVSARVGIVAERELGRAGARVAALALLDLADEVTPAHAGGVDAERPGELAQFGEHHAGDAAAAAPFGAAGAGRRGVVPTRGLRAGGGVGGEDVGFGHAGPS